jgi:hypothetical protein
MKKETNAFLEGQERIMQQRARRVAELQAIPAGVSEAPAAQPIFGNTDTITVERYSPVTGETTSRIVYVSRPLAQRIKKQELPSIAEIRSKINDLIVDLRESREAYQNLSLDDFYAPLKALEAEQTKYLRPDPEFAVSVWSLF